MNKIKELTTELESPFILFSQKEFIKSHREIQKYLPQVKHHYALKALPLKECINLIASEDGYIEFASIGELNLIKHTNPEMLNKCIFTHPIKKVKDIETVLQYGIRTMVVENLEELKKFEPYAHQVKLLIRLAFQNNDSLCNLSLKFGADETLFRSLMDYARTKNIKIIGCSFHVGSQMKRPTEHIKAIEKCKEIYNWVFYKYKVKFKVLNIGGGFPAQYTNEDQDLKSFCLPISEKLNELFKDVEIWSEPGRCIAANSMMVVSEVVGKVYKDNRMWYYLDDGVYGTYSGTMYEDLKYPLFALEKKQTKYLLSVFAGPTCDSVDLVAKDIYFQSLDIGDCVYSKRIGAYGWASRTPFNLVAQPRIVHFDFDLNEIEELEKHEFQLDEQYEFA